MEHAVIERVLSIANQRLHEPLTLDDLASIARFSKYHFARMFRRVTGLSPRRFLYALRLQEAKRLLLTTSQSVAEISNDVGYQSVGTFTYRFAASVGVSPTVYRHYGGDVDPLAADDGCRQSDGDELAGALGIEAGATLGSPVFLGFFRGPLAEGRPECCVALTKPGNWRLRPVPDGRWYLLAVSARADTAHAVSPAWFTMPEHTMLGVAGPLTVRGGVPTTQVELRMRPMRLLDPPVLAAFARPVAPSASHAPGVPSTVLTHRYPELGDAVVSDSVRI